MLRLREIVKILEEGQVSLDESMKLYEEGVSLVRCANKLLADAKQKLIVVSGEDGDNE
jgi:exodeoxyribonuclease VII small subunit